MRQTRPVLSISQGSKSLGERREPVHGCYLMASVHETCKFSALCASRRKLNEPLTVRLPLSRLSLLGGPVMKHTITTIGYEGSTIGDFVAALRHASINVLIDVRELPLSRKKGFSKNQLAETLAASGIEYVHLRGLGDPKDGRTAARAGNYHLFEGIFCRHMQTEAALRDITTAADLVSACRACLMCFECDHTKCHRSIVAERLANITQLTVTPLTVRDVRLGRIAA